MSRLSKKPLPIPHGATAQHEANAIVFGGPKGKEKVLLLPFVEVRVEKDSIAVSSKSNIKQARANVGTMVSLMKNAMQGVTEGFLRVLEIEGVGYRAVIEGQEIVLSLGYVNPVRVAIPNGIAIVVEKSVVKISGTNKGMVTQTAAKIRALKKPEPYKGKGIRYQGEVVRRKVGKKAAAAKAG